jgi:hypothetical protein
MQSLPVDLHKVQCHWLNNGDLSSFTKASLQFNLGKFNSTSASGNFFYTQWRVETLPYRRDKLYSVHCSLPSRLEDLNLTPYL